MACSRARQVDHRDNLHKPCRSHRYIAEHGKHLFSASDLLERLMPRSFESLKGVMRPHDVSNCELTSESTRAASKKIRTQICTPARSRQSTEQSPRCFCHLQKALPCSPWRIFTQPRHIPSNRKRSPFPKGQGLSPLSLRRIPRSRDRHPSAVPTGPIRGSRHPLTSVSPRSTTRLLLMLIAQLGSLGLGALL
jgi:hypothetical protein